MTSILARLEEKVFSCTFHDEHKRCDCRIAFATARKEIEDAMEEVADYCKDIRKPHEYGYGCHECWRIEKEKIIGAQGGRG